MSSVLHTHLGTLELLDLQILSEAFDRAFVPYPFMFTKPSRFDTRDAALAYARTVPDRFRFADLQRFTEPLCAYTQADIRVEGRVQYIPADTPSVRVIGWRAGQRGFLGVQLAADDVVDIYAISPYDLGAAIAETVELTQPGRHRSIVIPHYVARSRADFDTGHVALTHPRARASQVTVTSAEISAYATVQSHWRPARRWGFDTAKPALVWVRVDNDGEYLYIDDNSCATPMSRTVLRQRIDRAIAEDIAALREARGDQHR